MNAGRLDELCKDQVDFTGKCQDCDREVKVTIKRTDEGFLVTGGAVYEPTRDKFYLKCDECFEREPVLKNFQPCLVFSRIVGYLTPINQWNDGKKAEFSIRKTFNLDKALAQPDGLPLGGNWKRGELNIYSGSQPTIDVGEDLAQ